MAPCSRNPTHRCRWNDRGLLSRRLTFGPKHVRILFPSPADVCGVSNFVGGIRDRPVVRNRCSPWRSARGSNAVLERKDHGGCSILVGPIPLVLHLLCDRGRVVRVFMDAFGSPPVVWLVDFRVGLNLVHILLSGSGQRGDQRLVRTVLRPCSGGAFEVGTGHAVSVLHPTCN